MTEVERTFSASGGEIIQQARDAEGRFRFAIGHVDDDADFSVVIHPVDLEEREAVRLATWLLRQAMDDDDFRIVRSVIQATRWSYLDVEQERLEAQAALADATADAQLEALDRARDVEDEARYYEEETL